MIVQVSYHLPLVFSLVLSGFIHLALFIILKFTFPSAAYACPKAYASFSWTFRLGLTAVPYQTHHLQNWFSWLPLNSLLPSPPSLSVTWPSVTSLGHDLLTSATYSSRWAKLLLSHFPVASPLSLFLGSYEYTKFRILAFKSLYEFSTFIVSQKHCSYPLSYFQGHLSMWLFI